MTKVLWASPWRKWVIFPEIWDLTMVSLYKPLEPISTATLIIRSAFELFWTSSFRRFHRPEWNTETRLFPGRGKGVASQMKSLSGPSCKMWPAPWPNSAVTCKELFGVFGALGSIHISWESQGATKWVFQLQWCVIACCMFERLLVILFGRCRYDLIFLGWVFRRFDLQKENNHFWFCLIMR